MTKRKPKPRPDEPQPTDERLERAGWFVQRAGRTITMRDDALGRALMRQIVSEVQYQALERYALHWLASGLGSQLKSPDLEPRIKGVASDSWLVHRDQYRRARAALEAEQAWVCDQVACYDVRLTEVGILAGYRSKSRAREYAGRVLRSGADSLTRYFDRRR